jgi:hypothetical protein
LATHATFDDVLAISSPELRPVCKSIRRQIRSRHEDFVLLVWPKQKIASFGFGPKKMSEHYAYVAVNKSHINLGFYYGASLSDPAGLLEGTGKKLRHVKLRDVSGSRSPEVIALLHEAIAERQRHLSGG